MHATDRSPAIGLRFIKCLKLRPCDVWQSSRQRHYSQRPRLDLAPAKVDPMANSAMARLDLAAFSNKKAATFKLERARVLLTTGLGSGGSPVIFCTMHGPFIDLLHVGQFQSGLRLIMLRQVSTGRQRQIKIAPKFSVEIVDQKCCRSDARCVSRKF